ncbi:MAG: formate/nitrite transporter family protein [Candidatus Rokubacteria bacterium]|nr:formate/nitrite transporter family protein [Candidatus Rokubacteria bacterium]
MNAFPQGADALLPPDMARRAEDIGVAKAAIDTGRLLVLAALAGAFIALGGVFATVALAGTAGAPWGPARVLAGLVFSLGLILVLVGGAELFTGNNLIVMAWAARRVTTRTLLRNWAIVFAGNFVGAVAIAGLVWAGRSHELGGGALGVAAVGIAAAKVRLGFAQAVALGILCNLLVCLAVWLTFSARTTTDRILAIVPPISAFVAAGFEHSVANMYFVPLGLLIARFDPAFIAAHDLTSAAAALSWTGFLAGNLLPVTIGNVIGGTVLVGAVYWFVYLRRPEAPAGPRAAPALALAMHALRDERGARDRHDASAP